ncbi:uncharacterized protein BT62DRAFT_1008903 [Guyanagaster necrorhizus]|uniref:Uncharacterized protein n=1 Tax=Guyanagaster necrorhizus TaxID=856835 RepID=A0A9P8AQB4_9AGAR|nr:uncharacterized protein BT62DRAFT_1008903 [Guyanagaster necrorhizus MCA 3950]KAG7443825.1 hypothetical protein BT62DRAFT_1008903 [Guyanagaster necrorhizus MCA 3950]
MHFDLRDSNYGVSFRLELDKLVQRIPTHLQCKEWKAWALTEVERKNSLWDYDASLLLPGEPGYKDGNPSSMVIDEEASRAGRFLKFSKTRSSDVVTGDKRKEPYKEEPSSCVHCGANSHSFADCSNKGQATSQRFISKDSARACKRAKPSFPLPSAREYFHHGSRGIGERRPASALGLVSAFANDEGAAPSVDALRESYKGSAMGRFTVERPEHLAKLESALMGDVLVLQHTLYAAEKQRAFLLDELERVQSALHPSVPAPADSGDPAPVETETPSAPSTSSNVEPPSA